MAVYTLARFAVRPEAREEAERAMHELAMQVRQELGDTMWTTYRDVRAPYRYVSLIRSGNEADEKLFAALQPLVVGEVELTPVELVTSSDLAPRHRDRGSPRHRRRLGR